MFLMRLKAGIIGLPNVGKSTLFNILTQSQVPAANYPFTTIKPNVAVVPLHDTRLNHLTNLFASVKVVPATCTFVDIAGLVSGASQGVGLGNQFLANIRNVHALVHVVRFFNDPDVQHVTGTIDPLRDVQTVNSELVKADQNVVVKALSRVGVLLKSSSFKNQLLFEQRLLEKVADTLKQDKWVNTLKFSTEEQKIVLSYNFLTFKKVLYVANISSVPTDKKTLTKQRYEAARLLQVHPESLLVVAVKDTQSPHLQENTKKLVQKTFTLLDLATFFTAGSKETKAWVFCRGATALECAGKIHSDIARGFIRVEVTKYNDFYVEQTHHLKVKKGKMRLEGKNYVVQDGDVCHFRFNVRR